MTLSLTRLLFIATVATTLAGCSTNPISKGISNPNTSGGGYTGSNIAVAPPSVTNKDAYIDNNTNIDKYNYQGSTSYTGEGAATTTTDYENYTNNSSQAGFVVQLIASISEEKARGIKETFIAEGYSAIQNRIDHNGQILYRVQIGPYTTRNEAIVVLNKMRRRYQRNPYVDVAFINENR